VNATLDTPRFLFADLAEVTGIPQINLKSWLARGSMSLGDHDRDASGSGKRRLLTLRTVYEFAIASRLVALGLSPGVAFQNAIGFSGRKIGERKGEDKRNPETLLYDSGKTIFVIYPEADRLGMENAPHEVFGTYSYTSSVETDSLSFNEIFRDDGLVAAVVYCNPILQGVDKALGIRRE
jgi:hypothetical protein